jgi:antirestriction protein
MARIYVGTYAEYVSENLEDNWLNPEDYQGKEEFLKACRELHKDENDPEIMFQNWEGVPNQLISESSVDESLWQYFEACEKYGKEVIDAYLKCFDDWDENDFNERYHGEFNSWEEMAENFLEEIGAIKEIPERLRFYFDYEKYAKDIRLGGDMVEHNGHFFWGS